jgi:beta-glucosidase
MTQLSRAALGASFRLGAATSSYQIEGAVGEDGRGPSIWDTFSHTPGKTKLGHNGDVACDHYHRMPADVTLLDWLGLDAYRFSIAWPRVLPDGTGAVSSRGLDFYERLVDALLAKNIAPCATLYHWDLPQALVGGWLARDTAQAFAEYSARVAERIGDRVAMWFTHNEPWCQAFLGYHTGYFAPGHRELADALSCAHHLLVSHGLAVQALRANSNSPVGIAINLVPAHPASNRAADIAAARRFDGYFNRWFVEPLVGRGYPADLVEQYGAAMPTIAEGDLQRIAEPIDVLGVNYYERGVIEHDPEAFLGFRSVRVEGMARTLDREIYAEGLAETLRRLHGEYGFSRLVVTENGAAFADEVARDGLVHDAGRVDFFRQHLTQIAKVRAEGVPVDAFFAWSLMDNFEWAEGYTLRYGVCHVDFETQRRSPKDSARFLRSLGRHAGTARESEPFVWSGERGA